MSQLGALTCCAEVGNHLQAIASLIPLRLGEALERKYRCCGANSSSASQRSVASQAAERRSTSDIRGELRRRHHPAIELQVAGSAGQTACLLMIEPG